MSANDYSRGELEDLVAQVVEKILDDTALCKQLAERDKGPVDCPPHTLCCSKNHICEGHGGFICSPPYRCQSGFEEKVVAL